METSRYELVNIKNMTPSPLKDGTAFRSWREDFERWAGLKVKGLQEVLKLIGGRRSWSSDVQSEVDDKLKSLGMILGIVRTSASRKSWRTWLQNAG